MERNGFIFSKSLKLGRINAVEAIVDNTWKGMNKIHSES